MPSKIYDDEKQETGQSGGHERLPMSDEVRNQEIADLEQQFEGKDATGNEKNDPDPTKDWPEDERGYYNVLKSASKGGSNTSKWGKMRAAAAATGVWKKSAGIGGIIGVILAAVAFFSFLGTFQLTHMTEFADNVFGAQTRRIIGARAAKHYILAADGQYFKKNGIGRIATGYGALNPETVRGDLRKKGWDISLNQDGRVVLSSITIVDGKQVLTPVESDDTRLSNKQMRSKISELFDGVYPQDSFLKRNMRTRTAFKSMGIQRVFFETPRQAVENWQLEMIKKIRNRLSLAQNPNLKATGIDDEAQKQADDIASKIDDPNFDPGAPGNMPDVSTVPDIAGGVGGGLLKGAQLDQYTQAACETVAYSEGVVLTAKAVRYATLIANAGMIYVMAHQIKSGEGVTGEQVGAVMALINRSPGIGASGSYRQMSGEKTANVQHANEFGMSLTGIGGGLATAIQAAKDLLSQVTIAGKDGNDYCRLTRNPFYQVGSAVVGGTVMVLSAIGTGGVSITGVVAKFTTSIAASVSWETAKAMARPYLARALVGGAAMLAYGPSQGGDKTFDAFAGGAMAMASASRYQNGMSQQLTLAQRAELEKTIATEKADKAKNQSVYTKYFALNNVDSALAKQLAIMPSNAKDSTIVAAKNIGALPSKLVNAVSLLTPSGRAHALVTEGNPYVINNALDLPFYSLTDEKVEKLNSQYDIVENEEWIHNSPEGLAGYTQWVNECFPANNPLLLHGMATTTDEESLISDKCSNLEDERYERYATYRMDRGIQQSILFMSKTSDCTDPDSEDPFCKDVDPGTEPSATATNASSTTTTGTGAQCVTTGITEPPADDTRTTWSGKTVNQRTKVMLEQAQGIIRQKYSGFNITVTQGSYGGISASRGSHDGGGAVDIGGNSNGFTGNMQKAEDIASALRSVGFAAWVRTPENSGFTWHIHANAIGDKDTNSTIDWMIKEYFAGNNGLDGSRKATDPHLPTIGRPIPEWALKYGSASCPVIST